LLLFHNVSKKGMSENSDVLFSVGKPVILLYPQLGV
jgi:hypothetical protein